MERRAGPAGPRLRDLPACGAPGLRSDGRMRRVGTERCAAGAGGWDNRGPGVGLTAVAVHAAKVQCCQIIRPPPVVLAAELAQVVPRIDACVVPVIENQAHRVVAHRLYRGDRDVALSGYDLFLIGAVALDLGAGAFDPQILHREGEG